MKEVSKKQFVQLIQSSQGIINSICRVYFPRSEDQKDIRQEIILQLWKAFPHFREEAKVSTWIYRVALNTVLNQLRKVVKHPEQITTELLNNMPAPKLIDDDFQQLRQVMSLLKAKDKALVILHLEGYNHKEIAAMLNTSPTNISTRFSRIKKRLHILYKKYTYES